VIECIVKYEGGGSVVFFMCSYFQRPFLYLTESVAHLTIVVERWTCDREVAGTSLTYRAVECGLASVIKQYNSVLMWRAGDAPKLGR